MYFRIKGHSSLANRPRDQQMQILRGFYQQNSRLFLRHAAVLLFIILGGGICGAAISIRAGGAFSWETALVVGFVGAVIWSGYWLWQLNGPMNEALSTYEAEKEAEKKRFRLLNQD